MFQACRPAGRLFYLVLAVVVAATGVRLAARDTSGENPEKTPSATAAKPGAAEPAPRGVPPAPQSGPGLTSVVDTVYMADGTPAQGILVITWPAFVAADGTAMAPGALNVTLGTNGALNAALAPNVGATPAGVYYTVVYQLQPSEVRTEYWVVPTTSPATLAQVRTTPGSGTAAQPVSMQYVNSALVGKANDNAVVHLARAETVTGTKSFSVPPNVPTPVGTGDVANKAYVDSSVATVGSGNYVHSAGGAMTGPLTLSGNPTSVGVLQNGTDDGTRGTARVAKTPVARTDADCENAALAILDDATGIAWSGTYETWSDFLPGAAADIFPGDAITVNVPSRGASFTAIVREVEIQIADPAGDRGFYTIEFANDLAAPLAIEYTASATTIALQDMPPLLETTQVGAYYQVDLTETQITAVTSTTVTVDAGLAPASGYGIEVRENDYGWGQANDRNLLGRFNTQTFSLARLAETQDYFLRLYDSSSPPKYSRYSAALHVDYPL